MKLLSCLRAPDAKRVLPPATVVASRSNPLTCETGAASRQLSLGGQVDGGSLAPVITFLYLFSRTAAGAAGRTLTVAATTGSSLLLSGATATTTSGLREKVPGTQWPWVPAGAIASRRAKILEGPETAKLYKPTTVYLYVLSRTRI